MSVTETANGESLSSCFAGGGATSTGARDCGAVSSKRTILFCMLSGIFHLWCLIRKRHSHSIAHAVHGLGRRLPRPFRACLQNIPSQPWILLEFLAPLLHGTQQLHQRVGGPTLALNA